MTPMARCYACGAPATHQADGPVCEAHVEAFYDQTDPNHKPLPSEGFIMSSHLADQDEARAQKIARAWRVTVESLAVGATAVALIWAVDTFILR